MSTTERVTLPEHMTYEEVMERTRALLPAIRERAAAAEAARRMPQETLQEITNVGLARMLVPKRWGGYELDYDAFSDSVIEFAKVDASAGWCYALTIMHPLFLARFPEEAQRDVWEKSPDVPFADSFFPGGQVTRAENGYRLSGKWPWVSGVDFCEWSILMSFASPSEGVPPAPHLFLVPRSDYEILDTWFVAGLKASGSNTVAVQDVFVPEHRVIAMRDAIEGKVQ